MAASNKPELPDEFGNPWMANLEEIELPEPVPFTPETVGWTLLAGVLLLVLLWLVWRLLKRWQADAYRREAAKELQEIENSGPEGLPELLKRVALAAYPRTQVAELSRDAWLGFLDGTLGTTDFTQGVGRVLPDLAYDSAAAGRMTSQETRELFGLSKRWIRSHRRV